MINSKNSFIVPLYKMLSFIKLKLRQKDFECSLCDKLILSTPIMNSYNNVNGIYCLECVGNNQVFYSFYRNTFMEGLIKEQCSDTLDYQMLFL